MISLKHGGYLLYGWNLTSLPEGERQKEACHNSSVITFGAEGARPRTRSELVQEASVLGPEEADVGYPKEDHGQPLQAQAKCPPHVPERTIAIHWHQPTGSREVRRAKWVRGHACSVRSWLMCIPAFWMILGWMMPQPSTSSHLSSKNISSSQEG